MSVVTLTRTCPHPESERWQHRIMWMCCLCGRWWWGEKKDTPAADIYGRAS